VHTPPILALSPASQVHPTPHGLRKRTEIILNLRPKGGTGCSSATRWTTSH
jgi:hypothetical protein